MSEIAILMAAGLGNRMKPLTDEIAKPLIKVHGIPMIETVLNALERRMVSHIYVVTGYRKEQFSYLLNKYHNLTLVENNEYMIKNNISSIHAVVDYMGNANCFVCEADLFISNDAMFQVELNRSCYFGKMIEGYSEDWLFIQDERGKIIHIQKGGNKAYNMVGIAYLTKKDADIIAKAIKKAYKIPGHELLFWDEIVDQQLNMLDLTVYPIDAKYIVELDTVTELAAVDPSYLKYCTGGNNSNECRKFC